MDPALQVGGRSQTRKVCDFLKLAETREMDAAIIVPETSGVVEARRFAQHVYARMLITTGAGTDAHSIADKPVENGLEAWRRPAQRFGPSST